MCGFFFLLENTSREILNTSLYGFVGIYIWAAVAELCEYWVMFQAELK